MRPILYISGPYSPGYGHSTEDNIETARAYAVYLWCGRCGQAIEPPTGDALREVLLGMHTIPDEGIDAQILRW